MSIVSDSWHQGLLEAEWSLRLGLAQALGRLSGGLHGGGSSGPCGVWIKVRVLGLLLEHNHDLADLSAAQRTLIV